MRSVAAVLALPLMAVLVACGDKDDTGSDGGGDDGGTDDGGTVGDDGGGDGDSGTAGDDGGSDSGGPSLVDADVNGMVVVKLIDTDDETGDIVEVEWSDTPWADTGWPFGGIFVGAAESDGEGDVFYRGDTIIREPSFEGDAYNVDVTLEEGADVYLIARLDMRGDGIIDTWDPKGVHGTPVSVADGDTIDDRNITITLDYDTALSWWYGGGGGCSDGTVSISGEANLGSPWATGDVAVLLYNSAGEGPLHGTRGEPSPVDGGTGASMNYSFATCANYGETQLRGAWDSNFNGLIDPADLWGTWVEDGEEANPLMVATSDLSGKTIEIPFGDGRPGLGVAPFVQLSGNVTYSTGSFTEFPEGSVLYVSALLFKPSGEFEVVSLAERGYGSVTYTDEDWAGRTELPFDLWVPSNTTVYVFANVDEGPEPDGILGQPFDWVGSAGGEYAGWVPTGASGDDDINIDLSGGEPPAED